MTLSRRDFFMKSSVAMAAGSTVLNGVANLAVAADSTPPPNNLPYTPVITPNGSTMPWTMKDGVKEFRITCEPVKREFSPGMTVNCWGYNGQTPGPTIEAVEGDTVRFFVTNKLPEATTIHWHGLLLPNGMDGVAGLTQPKIEPGETYVYEFTLRQHGTQMYHPHADEMVQMALGMVGFFIIHPKQPPLHIDRDFAIFLGEWAIEPGSATPNPMVMTDFNIFTFNSRAFPGTDPLIVKLNDRTRIRIANLTMDNHPMHLHGHKFFITESDGGPIPASAQFPNTTVDVPPGTTRVMEFVADNPGDWAFHCHKTHHTMNAMSHDLPNVIGVNQDEVSKKLGKLLPSYMSMGSAGMGEMTDMAMGGPANTLPMMAGAGPFGSLEMGGMFTVLKVRENLTSYDDPGWYKAPPGTQARKV